MLELPQQLLTSNDPHRSIDLKGCTIVESCFYENQMHDTALLFEHQVIHILSGRIIISEGDRQTKIEKGETVLIKKDTYFEFTKQAKVISQDYQSVLFFLKNEFISDFTKTYQIENAGIDKQFPNVIKFPNNPLITGFILSLIPYFGNPMGNKSEIFRLKTFEFLFQLNELDKSLFSYFFQLLKPHKIDLVKIMEEHYTKNLSLEHFARLSNRSLATFKRDFQKTFNLSPALWLKTKRLKLAHYLLANTSKTSSQIYLEVGFEDLSHFSKSFKQQFGYLPSSAKQVSQKDK